MKENILITGVAGFIGSNIAKKFIKEGYKVFGVDDLSNGAQENVPQEVIFHKVDLSQNNPLNDLIIDSPLILHLAGQSSGEISFEDPINDLQKNTSSTLNLIQYGIKNNASKLIYASSMSVYGEAGDEPISEINLRNPLSCYGISKLASENYLRVFSNYLPYVSMRMFNVYGPGQDLNNLKQGMVSIYVAQALRNKNICVKGELNRFRDFIYIDDVVEAWFKASLMNKVSNVSINIGTGKRTSVEDLLSLILKKIPESKYFIEDNTPGDQKGIYSNNSLMKNLIGLKEFTSLESGLNKFIDYIIKNKS